MHILKTFFCFSLFFFLFSNLSYSQFNTLRRNKPVLVKEIIDEEKNKESEKNEVSEEKNEVEFLPPPLIQMTSDPDAEPQLLFHLPISELIVNSPYGYRIDPFSHKKKFHAGVDFAATAHDVFAIMPGKIKEVGYDKKGLGNYVIIEHGEFTVTYGHLYTSIGSKGDYVGAGTKIGITGNTGRSTGEHLHLGIKHKRKNIDPMPLIRYIEKYINDFNHTTTQIAQ
ncbi:peptidase M23 [Bacteroidia bacterium]|nr:peptidase M23 [Bacteroidia bacterium]GHT61574.1 peptidase M23 [Bacteroidia bacterium]